MEQVAVQDDDELLAGFNEVLGQHMERLLGFKLGPAGMPLTVTTLACLALLSDRKNDLKDADAGTGYTAEGLLSELSDLGLKEYGECEDILRQLSEKGYVRLVREGGVIPSPVALRLEDLLERVFPKMPGLNFVAYVTQTMGEVRTGRKDLSLALSQFDQTLTMQGHTLLRRKPGNSSRERLQRGPHLPISPRQTPLPPRSRQEPNVSGSKPDGFTEPQGPRILGSGAAPIHAEVLEFQMGDLDLDSVGAPETESVVSRETANAPAVQETGERLSKIVTGQSAPLVQGETQREIPDGSGGEALLAPAPGDNTPKPYDRPEAAGGDDAPAVQEAPPVEPDQEEGIEKQIRAFGEELFLRCPMCNNDRVAASTTPTGRTYYKCVSPDCHFVSWGKPLHQSCPRCHNPFLIQISDKSGRVAHKCPRATCSFHRLVGESGSANHAAGGLPRKVVRRRLVRRKH